MEPELAHVHFALLELLDEGLHVDSLVSGFLEGVVNLDDGVRVGGLDLVDLQLEVVLVELEEVQALELALLQLAVDLRGQVLDLEQVLHPDRLVWELHGGVETLYDKGGEVVLVVLRKYLY